LANGAAQAITDDRASSEASSEAFFYGEPQRTQCLNFLLHLAPYSNDALMVTGKPGSGKTTLLKQFMANASESWQICLINAKSSLTQPQFLELIDKRYKTRFSEIEDEHQQIEAIASEFHAMQARGQRPILIIDNAHHVQDWLNGFLESLYFLIQDKGEGFSLILSGDSTLASSQITESLQSFGLHSFVLEGLNFEETKHYLFHYLTKLGQSPDDLTNADIKKIFKQSHGNLTLINTLARQWLKEDRVSPETTAPAVEHTSPVIVSKTKKQLPRYIAALVLLLVVGSALYYQDEINQFVQPIPSPDPVQEEIAPETATVQEVPNLLNEFDEIFPGIIHDEQSTAEFDAEMDAMLTREDKPTAAIGGEQPEKVVETDQPVPALPFDVAPLVSGPVQQESENPATEGVLLPQEADSTKELTTDSQMPSPEPTKPRAAIESPEKIIETEVTSPEQPTIEPPPPTVALPSLSTDETGILGESWLLKQKPNYYTLQLIAVSKVSRISRIVKPLDSKRQYAYFAMKRNGKILYGLVYGIYPTRKKASAAGKTLPKAFAKVTPLIKKLKTVQNDIVKVREQ